MPSLPYASVNLDVDVGTERLHATPQSDTPFRILLLGDFSGRANRGEPAPERLRPVLIDRDNFDQVLARMRPELELGAKGRGTVLRFRELDDFHPDRIYEQDPPFEKLRATRRMLVDPATFAEAAATVKSWSSAPPAPAPEPDRPKSPPAAAAFAGGNLLDSILDATEGDAAQSVRQPDDLQRFIDRAVAGQVAPRQDPKLPELVAELDATAAKLMRAILHHRDFQALESAWRAAYWLVRGLETGPMLKIYVLDIAKAELAGGMRELHRVLVKDAAETMGAEPWSLVAANFTFARTEADVNLLIDLSRIVRAAGASLVAEADPGEAQNEDAEIRWKALRHAPEATHVGLALPRFLLRLPYGKKTDTVERFAFEEMNAEPEHGHYLWGNPAFACALLIGRAFEEDGWDLRPGSHLEIGGLPLHVYEADGEQQLKPCAEMWMTDHDAEWIMEQGFMALASIKHQDAIRLVRFQSIAEPLTGLAGRW